MGALDCRTGQRLWRWRSPKRLAGLLRPWVLVHAALQSRRAIADARAAHSRHVIWRELTHGQWRHPAALAGRLRMAVDEDTAYISTSMGLFALRTADGCLRWHALPTADLSLIAPAVAAERGGR